jgi:hypothetical protein
MRRILEQGSPSVLAASSATSRRWSVFTSLGAIVSTALSASCALGLLLTLLGLGGSAAVVSRALHPLGPYFTVTTVLLLGTGFYFTHLKRRSGSCDLDRPSGVPARGASRGAKALYWCAAGLAIVFLVLPYFG